MATNEFNVDKAEPARQSAAQPRKHLKDLLNKMRADNEANILNYRMKSAMASST